MNRIPNIAILTGGDSLEAVSSYTSADNVFNSLSQKNYNRYLVEIKGGVWRLLKGDDLPEGGCDKLEFDYRHCCFIGQTLQNPLTFAAVIPMIHGRPAETGQLQGYLDIVGMKYTGSGVLASALTMSKSLCKRVLSSALAIGFPADLSFASSQGVDIDRIERKLGYPLMVKPDAEGSGLGVAQVHNREQLHDAISALRDLPGQVLFEQSIHGKEITVAALASADGWQCLPVAEVERPGHDLTGVPEQGMLTYQSRQHARLIIPARIPARLCQLLQEVASSIGKLLGLRHYFRVDFMIDDKETVYFLEVNSIPGFSTKSVFTQQLQAGGLAMEAVWSQLLEETLSGTGC
jgi:D-alanine-D-alanine ligase